ncbi:MAG: hypothetical protein Q8P90_04420 [bacterium]|nr:hypothetical protein [bacterium]
MEDKNQNESFEQGSMRSAESGMSNAMLHRDKSTALTKHTEGMDFSKRIPTKTGDWMTEVEPSRQYFTVHDVYEQMVAGLERKSKGSREAELKKMEAEMGVDIDTDLPDTEADKPTTMEEGIEGSGDKLQKEVLEYLKKLAENVVDALNQNRRSIAVIETDDIGKETTSKLGAKGDANFVVNEQAGHELLESLKQQHTPMKIKRKNNYGFVLQNRELGIHMVFVFQEGLGGPKTEQPSVDDPEYVDVDENEPAPDVSNDSGDEKTSEADEDFVDLDEGVAGSDDGADASAEGGEDAQGDVIDLAAARKVAQKRKQNDTTEDLKSLFNVPDNAKKVDEADQEKKAA